MPTTSTRRRIRRRNGAPRCRRISRRSFSAAWRNRPTAGRGMPGRSAPRSSLAPTRAGGRKEMRERGGAIALGRRRSGVGSSRPTRGRSASRKHAHDAEKTGEAVLRRAADDDLAVGLDEDVVGAVEVAEEIDLEEAARAEAGVEGAVREVARDAEVPRALVGHFSEEDDA